MEFASRRTLIALTAGLLLGAAVLPELILFFPMGRLPLWWEKAGQENQLLPGFFSALLLLRKER